MFSIFLRVRNIHQSDCASFRATAPLVTIVLTFFIDRLRPTRRAVWGGLLAVVGAVALKDAQSGWPMVSTLRKLLNI